MAKYKIGDYVKVKNDIEAGKDDVVEGMLHLKNEIGKRIERGEAVHISSDDFEDEPMLRGNSVRVCKNCGYKTQEDFEYCPKCWSKF